MESQSRDGSVFVKRARYIYSMSRCLWLLLIGGITLVYLLELKRVENNFIICICVHFDSLENSQRSEKKRAGYARCRHNNNANLTMHEVLLLFCKNCLDMSLKNNPLPVVPVRKSNNERLRDARECVLL